MNSALKSLRTLADPTRLRLIALLENHELSVAELQDITHMGQSRISTHLGVLQENGMLTSRRDGKRTFYRLNSESDEDTKALIALAIKGAKESAENEADQINLTRIIERRTNQAKLYFNQIAGRFDKCYGPGRSWEAFGQMLLRILPPLNIADLGAGEGLLSELLALRAKKVIAVDNSAKIVEFGRRKGEENHLKNLEFRLGDLEEPPIDPESVDLVILSQALHHATNPERAIRSAFRILRPHGQIMVLDLLKHDFDEAHDLYGDRWLGFDESELHKWLQSAGFKKTEIEVVSKEDNPPYFQTILACGTKRG